VTVSRHLTPPTSVACVPSGDRTRSLQCTPWVDCHCRDRRGAGGAGVLNIRYGADMDAAMMRTAGCANPSRLTMSDVLARPGPPLVPRPTQPPETMPVQLDGFEGPLDVATIDRLALAATKLERAARSAGCAAGALSGEGGPPRRSRRRLAVPHGARPCRRACDGDAEAEASAPCGDGTPAIFARYQPLTRSEIEASVAPR
jgi:hypothetical protein